MIKQILVYTHNGFRNQYVCAFNPSSSSSNNNVSILNKSDEAKKYVQAIEISPQDSKIWYNKGNDLDNLNKYYKAI